MPVPARRLPSGTIVVDPVEASEGRTVAYVRVSSHDQRGDLEAQAGRLTAWCTTQGIRVDEVMSEVGSGVNGRRPKLARLLCDPEVQTIVVEHRDRVARFGVEYLHAALAATGRRIVVVDTSETTDDLVRDMVEVLTWMCARLYGRRGARNRAMRAVTATKHELAEAAE
jgi:putative resolvase